MARPRKTTVAEKPKKDAPAAFATVDDDVISAIDEKSVESDKTASKTYTHDEVERLVREATAKAVAEAMANVSSLKLSEDVVTVMYMDEVAPQSVLDIGQYGTMRPGGCAEIPKKEFGNKFMTALVRKLIDKRELLVLDGLTKDERERWNCDYKDGEVLDVKTFDKMLDLPTEKLAEIFEKLCPEHKRFVACRMITAKEKGDNRMSMDKAKRINDLSKPVDPAGMLKPVMEAYSAEIAR